MPLLPLTPALSNPDSATSHHLSISLGSPLLPVDRASVKMSENMQALGRADSIAQVHLESLLSFRKTP